MSEWKDVWDGESRGTKEQLESFSRNFVIDFTRNGVRGALPNGNLAPLQLNNNNLFNGILELVNGGTNADLSGEGPGVLKMASMGAAVTVGPVLYTDVGWASGSAAHGQPLLYDIGGPTAEFGPLPLGSTDATSGQLLPARGGTGVDNGSRTLAVNTNSGTLAFSSASLTLTIPATGTAALLGTAQTFSADQTIAADLIFSGTGRRILADFSNATVASRAAFQTSTVNGNTLIPVLPNGTATTAAFTAYNTSDPDNAGRIVLTATPTAAQFNTNFSGTGSAIPLEILITSVKAASFNTDRSVSLTQWLEMVEITAPAAPAANGVRIYAVDNGAGKTRLMALFSSGAAQQLAIQP